MKYELPPGIYMQPFKNGDGHWAWKGGRPIRSISKILERIYPMDPHIDPWYLERGRMVHSATVMIDDDKLDWGALDERIKPFCDAYVSFKMMAAPVMEATELTVVHPSCVFGARLDRVMSLPAQTRRLVVDIKCGTGKEDRYWCQVAGCTIALDEDHAGDYDLALLNLGKDGHPHFTVADDPGKWIERFREILKDDIPAG